MEDVLQLLVALGAGGVIVEAIRGLWQRRNNNANYADVISRTAVGLLAPLKAQVMDLEAEVAELKHELMEARDECAKLRMKLHEANVDEADARAARRGENQT